MGQPAKTPPSRHDLVEIWGYDPIEDVEIGRRMARRLGKDLREELHRVKQWFSQQGAVGRAGVIAAVILAALLIALGIADLTRWTVPDRIASDRQIALLVLAEAVLLGPFAGSPPAYRMAIVSMPTYVPADIFHPMTGIRHGPSIAPTMDRTAARSSRATTPSKNASTIRRRLSSRKGAPTTGVLLLLRKWERSRPL
jgi:hypothetical protein